VYRWCFPGSSWLPRTAHRRRHLSLPSYRQLCTVSDLITFGRRALPHCLRICCRPIWCLFATMLSSRRCRRYIAVLIECWNGPCGILSYRLVTKLIQCLLCGLKLRFCRLLPYRPCPRAGAGRRPGRHRPARRLCRQKKLPFLNLYILLLAAQHVSGKLQTDIKLKSKLEFNCFFVYFVITVYCFVLSYVRNYFWLSCSLLAFAGTIDFYLYLISPVILGYLAIYWFI
jgi:hypothetical protein